MKNNQHVDNIDVNVIKQSISFRYEFANELSDIYSILPDYTIHFIGVVIIAVYLVAKLHYDRLSNGWDQSEESHHLIRRMKADYRILTILRKKLPHLFAMSHLDSFYDSIDTLLKLVELSK